MIQHKSLASTALGAVLAVFFMFTGSSCATCIVGEDALLVPGTYYTQYPMYVERDIVRARNPRRGGRAELIQINTPVHLVGCKRGRLELRREDGRTFLFENRERDTMESMDAVFQKAFADEPVPLDGLTQHELDALHRGTAIVGMSRGMVMMVEGPPPAGSADPMTESTWVYKKHGWGGRVTIHFDEHGNVSSITE